MLRVKESPERQERSQRQTHNAVIQEYANEDRHFDEHERKAKVCQAKVCVTAPCISFLRRLPESEPIHSIHRSPTVAEHFRSGFFREVDNLQVSSQKALKHLLGRDVRQSGLWHCLTCFCFTSLYISSGLSICCKKRQVETLII